MVGLMTTKPRVLAVDDTPANLIALDAVLEREFDLMFARSGQEALDRLRVDPDVAVILMDVQMPIMDGFETAERIKAMPACRDIPIVFITAVYREDPYVKRGFEVGGVDYFTKPFDPELLRLKLSMYATFRKQAAELQAREDRIRATEELLKAGRKLTSILESIPVGILVADLDGRICQTNDEVSRICKADDAFQHDAYGEVLAWWSASGAQLRDPDGALVRALRTGASTHDEKTPIICCDGSEKLLFISASPLRGLGGAIVGAVLVMKDLTVPIQVEEEFERRIARLLSVGVEMEQSAPVPLSSPRVAK